MLSCLRLVHEARYSLAAFGFTAALLEGLPLVGLIFNISNRIGAAMWAHGRCCRLHFCGYASDLFLRP